MTFGSLFSGIGGIDLGLERAGMECRWQVENDAFCSRVLEKHWPGVKRYGDIREVRGDELEPVDLICGGFPCQDLSVAGKRAGIEGARSGLWFEFTRIVGMARPRYVLIENVPGLLVRDAMRRVVGELARLGYVGCWRSLRASEFGASHLRKRIFIVAYASGNHTDGCDPIVEDTGILGNTDRRQRGWAVTSERTIPGSDGGCGALADGLRPRLEERGRERSDHAEERAPAERICGTLLPAFAPGPSDPRWPAILAERPDLAPALESPFRGVADGLPGDLDGAMRDRTKRLSSLGNAVVPQVAQWIGKKILAFEEET